MILPVLVTASLLSKPHGGAYALRYTSFACRLPYYSRFACEKAQARASPALESVRTHEAKEVGSTYFLYSDAKGKVHLIYDARNSDTNSATSSGFSTMGRCPASWTTLNTACFPLLVPNALDSFSMPAGNTPSPAPTRNAPLPS